MTTEIKNTYLMWIGKEHYADIAEWTDEAIKQGISKRLPNMEMGAALMEPGVVIFVAHDEGESKPCPSCAGTIQCPDCRKRWVEGDRLEEQGENVVVENPQMASRLFQRKTQLYKDCENCSTCGGTGKIEDGTGGSVTLMYDGIVTERWDYRRYNYWLHQPKQWTPKDVVSKDMCSHCGGTGRLPEGKVFGLFLPDTIEYILPEGADPELQQAIEERKIKTVTMEEVRHEERRRCGIRKSGGVYVVASTKTNERDAKEIVVELVKEGKINADGVEINGGLIRFIEPIGIDVKRFRGLKKWNLDPRAEREAEMILDALAG